MAIASRGDVGILLKRLFGLVNPSETYPIEESVQPVAVVVQRPIGLGAGERPLARRYNLGPVLAGERPAFGVINPTGNRSVAYLTAVWASLTANMDVSVGITNEAALTGLAGFVALSPRVNYSDGIGEPNTASPFTAFTALTGITGSLMLLPGIAVSANLGRVFPLQVRLEPGAGVIFEAVTNGVNTLTATIMGHELQR